jgi:hypothetical protein
MRVAISLFMVYSLVMVGVAPQRLLLSFAGFQIRLCSVFALFGNALS